MADPALIDCVKDEWILVAEDVVAGMIHRISTAPSKYLQTYRTAGGDEPTEEEEGVPLFNGVISEDIAFVGAVDIYVFAKDKAGKVRVDL